MFRVTAGKGDCGTRKVPLVSHHCFCCHAMQKLALSNVHSVLPWLLSGCSHLEELLGTGHDSSHDSFGNCTPCAVAACGMTSPANLAALAFAWLNIAFLSYIWACQELNGSDKTLSDACPALSEQLLFCTQCSQLRVGCVHTAQGHVVLAARQKLWHVKEACRPHDVHEIVMLLSLQSHHKMKLVRPPKRQRQQH